MGPDDLLGMTRENTILSGPSPHFLGYGIGTIMLIRSFIIIINVSLITGCVVTTVDSKLGAVEW